MKTTENNALDDWRDVPDYEGIYQVSRTGIIRSLDRIGERRASETRNVRGFTQRIQGRILRQNPTRSGYLAVSLKKRDGGKTTNVHQIVALAFLEPSDGRHVNHKDGDKTNNRADNLEWVTRSENMAHAHAMGLCSPPRGERAHWAKLTETQVREIKHMLAEGLSQRKIAAHFGIGQRTVGHINTGHNWKHVE